jgi:hypothetical protein
MINLPVFPFKDVQAFYDNLVASEPDPNTHRPDPLKGAAFFASHPETARADFLEKAFLLVRHARKCHLIALATRPGGSCF